MPSDSTTPSVDDTTPAAPGATPYIWPLGHAGAHDAATACAEPMREWPKAHAVFRRDLAARFIGAVDKADLLRRLDEFSAEFRERLPATREAGPS